MKESKKEKKMLDNCWESIRNIWNCQQTLNLKESWVEQLLVPGEVLETPYSLFFLFMENGKHQII